MGLVSIRIDGRSYTLSCTDGKEAYIENCASYLDERARTIKAGIGPIPENMLLCLLCLTLADDLKQTQPSESRALKEKPYDFSALVETLNSLSEKLEKA